MRLSKSRPSPLLPVPLRPDPPPESDSEAPPSPRLDRSKSSSIGRATSELMDLVANHRPDLLKTLLDVLHDSKKTRQPVEELLDLITACGVSEATSPCATSTAIADDLEKLASTTDRWTHPAQIVTRPHIQALYHLCTTRLRKETGTAKERLENILPRLERTARLAEKAASRRAQETASSQK